MDLLKTAVACAVRTAQIPSFSSFEETIHPYIHEWFNKIPNAKSIRMAGNNLVYSVPGGNNINKTVALTAHLDKINHYGKLSPDQLSVNLTNDFIEGAMDDSVGLGVLLALATATKTYNTPDILFFFSEMEESKGLKEHPELIKNKGEGYEPGMGARRIAKTCLAEGIIPEEVITIDTTPLFKGKCGVALYSKHWEYNGLDPSQELKEKTDQVVQKIMKIDPGVVHSNNTNDYLNYGKEFNEPGNKSVVSIALEPAIFPYHQKGERVFVRDIERVLNILIQYLNLG